MNSFGEDETKSLSPRDLVHYFEIVKQHHQKYLAVAGVRLPNLGPQSKPTKDAIVLATLCKYIRVPVSKLELTAVVRTYYPETSDVQQARHLSRQKGFFIISGQRGDGEYFAGVKVPSGAYCLVSLEEPYPQFDGISGPRSARGGADFQELKQKFDYRCATCGSKEGEPSFLNRAKTTVLQEGHMDPTKPLELENMIPQCDECNRAYKDKFIFDGNGRTSDINIGSAFWRKRYRKI